MLILFIISQLTILLIIAALFVLLSFVWPPDSPWSPWWKTSIEVSRVVCDLSNLSKKDTLVELGSGNGTTLLVAAQEYGATCMGVEIDPLRYLYSRFAIWRSGFSKKITVYRKNFFKVDISRATVVYVYLVPKALKKLEKKFLEELTPGTKIVSYRYKIPYLEQVGFNKEHKMYIYQTPTSRKKQS